MQRPEDRDWVIKARFRYPEENDDPEAYWDEVLLNDMKRPCYAFRRGNILFTTTPPPRKPQVEKSCTSTCQINVADRTEKLGSDFCEVCCGIRSPSFSRRAHSFTTHFCTKVPAKRNTAGSSSSDQRSKSTDSSVSSNSLDVNQSYRNLLNSRGHISRLSAYLNTRGHENDDSTSSEYTSGTSSGCGINKITTTRSGCDKCGHSSRSTMATRSSIRSAATDCSYSSSYPSSCSSYFPFFLDQSCSSSACCDCSSDSCIASSFGSMKVTDREVERCEKARFFSNESSSESDNETCSSEMGWSFGSFCELNKRDGISRTAAVENMKSPARSVTSCMRSPAQSIVSGKIPARNLESLTRSPARSKTFCSKNPDQNVESFTRNSAQAMKSCSKNPARNFESFSKGITPFVSSTNRKLVMEKFGNIVSSLRKPGHHIGPSKNSDCMCDNCRSFFCKK